MIFVLPEVMFSASKPQWKMTSAWYLFTYVKTAIYLGVFYINYSVIIPRTLLASRRRIWGFILWNVVIIGVALVLQYTAQYWILWGGDDAFRHRGTHPNLRFMSFVVRDFGMMVLTLGLSAALRFGEKWRTMQQHHEQLMASQREEELQSLKSQLNPHFLFNTLNTIYALIEVSPEQAQEAVHELSALLRYVLYENPATVRLSREIGFVKNYITLMEIRIGSGAVKAVFDPGPDPEVPPLLFISLVENALKHGNTGVKDEPVEISISADANGSVMCVTRNHFQPKSASSKSKGGGIGIANLRRRLDIIYGEKASLVTDIEGNVYTAILTINA